MEPKKVKVIKLKKKYAIILVIALLGIFGVVAGSSYAFFTSSINGKEYVVYSGTLEIGYEKKTNVINIPNATPMSNSDGLATTPYSFDVKNNGTLAAKYQVRLEEDTNNTLPLEYVKISVYKNDIEYLKPTKLSNLNSNLVIVDNGLLDASGTDNYKVRLWVDLGAGNDVVGKEFKARIVIDGMQDVADGFDVLVKHAAKVSVSEEEVIKKINKTINNNHIFTLDQVCYAREYDIAKLVSTFKTQNVGLALVEGGFTGALGLAGIPLNIATSIFIYYRAIQSIAMYYGYDVRNRADELQYATEVFMRA